MATPAALRVSPMPAHPHPRPARSQLRFPSFPEGKEGSARNTSANEETSSARECSFPSFPSGRRARGGGLWAFALAVLMAGSVARSAQPPADPLKKPTDPPKADKVDKTDSKPL